MTTKIQRKTHTVDLEGKVLGRIAADIAVLLRGKNKPGYAPYLDLGDFVVVKNASKIKITGNKMLSKIYYHQTPGYLGSLKKKTLGKVFEKDPAEVFRRTVFGMLPKNKLRDQQIKRLKVEV